HLPSRSLDREGRLAHYPARRFAQRQPYRRAGRSDRHCIVGLGCHAAALKRQRSWLSLLPRRLMVEWTTLLSRVDWQAIQVRTPGRASRRFFGIGSPQSSHSSALSPFGVSARARSTASFTVSSICCSTAPSRVHPPPIFVSNPSLRWREAPRQSSLERQYG